MKALVIVQRILAVLVGIYGFILSLCEVDITAPISQQLAVTLGGVALVVLAIGWGILTGVEEDLFVRKSTR